MDFFVSSRVALSIAVVALVTGTSASAADSIGLFSREAATFFLRSTPAPGFADLVVQYGAPASDWIPITGDWDGNETVTIGLYSSSRGVAFLRNRNDPGFADLTRGWPAGAIPVPGDWNGDDKEDFGWYFPATGVFELANVDYFGDTSGFAPFPFGVGHQLPLAGDWNGDGRDGVAVYDPNEEKLFVTSFLGPGWAQSVLKFEHRLEGERIIAGDFDGDGRDGVARFDPVSSTFFIHDDLSSPRPNAVVQYGPPDSGWLPVAWEPAEPLEVLPANDGFSWSGPIVGQEAPVPPIVDFRIGFIGEIAAVEAHRAFPPNQGTLIDRAQRSGANRRGEYWTFTSLLAPSFGRNFFVVLFLNDGRTVAYLVPDGARRFPG